MVPLAGLGCWLWQLHQCEGGNVAAIVARAARCGISWLALRSGESRPDGTVTRPLVEALRQGGIEVAAWWYSVPGTPDLQVDHAKHLVERCGVEHLIIDAETEWESVPASQAGTPRVLHDFRAQAREFAHRLREAVGPDVYLADAPWPKPRSHTLFPFAEFGSVLQARHPQVYWKLSGKPFEQYAPEWEAQWASMPADLPVCPVGCAVNYDGTKRAPLSELAGFLNRYANREAYSIWSWQHIIPTEWALLEQRAAAPVADDAPIVSADNQPIYATPNPLEDDELPDDRDR